MVDLTEKSPFQKFTLDLQKFAALNPNLIENTLSNILQCGYLEIRHMATLLRLV